VRAEFVYMRMRVYFCVSVCVQDEPIAEPVQLLFPDGVVRLGMPPSLDRNNPFEVRRTNARAPLQTYTYTPTHTLTRTVVSVRACIGERGCAPRRPNVRGVHTAQRRQPPDGTRASVGTVSAVVP